MFTKTKIKKYDVSHVLALIYNNKILETSIFDLTKEKLANFIIDEFNKGHLQNSFIDNLEMYEYEKFEK